MGQLACIEFPNVLLKASAAVVVSLVLNIF